MLINVIVYALAVYGFVTLWMQLLHRVAWWYNHHNKELRILILVHNAESYIEHLYRSLVTMSRTTGRPLSLTFVDCGSQDDTIRILKILAKKDDHVTIIETSEAEHRYIEMLNIQESSIVLDLRS